jgi:hypothetical protein
MPTTVNRKKPLPPKLLKRLIRVTGGRTYGYGVEMAGLHGFDEIQGKNKDLAWRLCECVRDYVRGLPPQRQWTVFEPYDVYDAMKELELEPLPRIRT